MRNKSYRPIYYREPQQLYTVSSYPIYGFVTGHTPDNQVLAGIVHGDLIRVTFAKSGELQDVQIDPLTVALDVADSPVLLIAWMRNKVELLIGDLKIEDRVIQVRRFYISELGIGIGDFPTEIEEYLEDPQRFDLIDQKELEEEFGFWKEQGHFVFYWKQGNWIDSEGSVVAS